MLIRLSEIDSTYAQKIEEELNQVAESLAKARSVAASTVQKT
jgi:hypothetical protein